MIVKGSHPVDPRPDDRYHAGDLNVLLYTFCDRDHRTSWICEDNGMATESTVTGETQERRVSPGMKAERVFTVARKEFTDQVTGWRFLVILALFLAIALVGTYSGVGSYERDLDRYAQQLATMDNQNDGPAGMMPAKPPVEGVYSSMFRTLVSYGGLLALALTAYPVVFFAVAYTRLMRIDIRG